MSKLLKTLGFTAVLLTLPFGLKTKSVGEKYIKASTKINYETNSNDYNTLSSYEQNRK